MNSFQEFVNSLPDTKHFPERGVPGPNQREISTILNRLSRQQLHDLARAFDIEVMPDGTKDQILPALVMAEQRGVFKGLVKRPYYLAKAARDRDLHKGIPLEMENPDNAPKVDVPPAEMDFRTLQKVCSEGGMNTFGKGKKEMLEWLEAGN